MKPGPPAGGASAPAGAERRKKYRDAPFRGKICLLHFFYERKVLPVKDSIAQTAYGLVEEIFKTIEKVGLSNVGRTAEELFSVVKSGTLDILSAAIGEMDAAVLSAKKERKLDGLTVKERNVARTFTTSLGELHYKRTYFSLKDGKNIYLVDHLIGVEPNERLSKELCAEFVQYSASMSMHKAATVTGGLVSRQTVNNKLLAMKELVTEMERVKNTPSELHIFADEDHVHLRPKKSAFVPLVTVTEGMDTSNPKRHRTINPVHFQGFGMNNEAFIENVVAAVYERYDMDKVKNVFIHADGGNWITKLGHLMPNAIFVMDGFHLEKYFKKLFGLNGAKPYAGVIRKAVHENDFDSFVRFCASIDEKQDEKGKKALAELVNYFQNNWNSIVERLNGDHPGSCTEPLISHVLSERLSRNPLAWSREGLEQMVMLRIFTANGGKVTAEHIRVSRSKKERLKDHNARRNGLEIYNKYAEDQIKEAFGGHHDWSVFENELTPAGLTCGKLTGTTVLLKAFAELKPLVPCA